MIPPQLQADNGLDLSPWLQWAGGLLGAGTVGLLLREALRLMFARAQQNDQNQTTRRGEWREEVARLTLRVDELTARLDATNERANALFAMNAELRAENRALRERYHRFLNWVQLEPNLPQPPRWLYERVEGPTEREVMPRPQPPLEGENP